jgi:hypothetical protein
MAYLSRQGCRRGEGLFLKTVLSLPRFSPRAPPAAWAALTRSTDSIPTGVGGCIRESPTLAASTDGQGAMTAALPFGEFAKEAIGGEET